MENMQNQILIELVKTEMPYGKYKGRKLIDLPEHYLLWYKQKGLPKGKLGEQLALVLEVKANGLEYLFVPIRKMV
jgi:uncharacterized protein